MSRRKQHVPWTAAGTASEAQHSADDVVRDTGWVFNNRTGHQLDLAAFVETGDHETLAYLQAFGLDDPQLSEQTLVEIGAGIGRMTASFTRLFGRVIAGDLDAAFLERCRDTVAQFGRPERLQTSHVADGRTLDVADDVADLTFSYITLQHCHRDDALALAREAVRVTRPGGRIALNFRTWTGADLALWPAGKVTRALFKAPAIGNSLARHRTTARLGWQANRLAPAEVLGHLGTTIDAASIVRSPHRSPFHVAADESTYVGVHRSHWWLVATVS
ncbi:MAG: class I SAM-dependent methyltransferase [Actinobacteria bacterium]|nr:class I SAM-dependent methyltransferase [Actinomycetota bacterium]